MTSTLRNRIATTAALFQPLESALNSFVTSNSSFRLIRTISPSPTTGPSSTSLPPTSPAPSLSRLYILDSSFNPPTLAHAALARGALAHDAATVPDLRDPARILLLFSTANADKAADPSAYAQRLAMIHLFALELSDTLHRCAGAPDARAAARGIYIDIALTSAAFYTDKAAAIAAAQPPPYSPGTRQIYLLGYDTLTRFLAPRYYATHAPPLSALRPFFEGGCELCVMMRPDGSESAREEQAGYLARLREGVFEQDGFRAEWVGKIRMAEAEREAEGVSSTRVRGAAADGKWDEVRKMCFPSVAQWIEEHGLYNS